MRNLVKIRPLKVYDLCSRISIYHRLLKVVMK